MAIHGGTHFVISASFTGSGAPAYLARDGAWARDLQLAAPLLGEADRDAWLERARADEGAVCDAYFFDVSVDGGVIDPCSTRERIRARGPSVRIRRPD